VTSVKKFLYSVLEQVAEPYSKKYDTEDLRAHATSYGWPLEIVNSMTIDHTGTIKFSNPQYKEAAETLEYGTQDTPLSPAIRTYLQGVM
jgi:hypothetical protein